MSGAALSSFFRPASIAVVGAANDPARLRGKLFKILLDCGYGGPIYPVHPKERVIQGREAYPALADIPGGAELVLIAAPGAAVPGVAAEAAAAGAKAAVILSSGVDASALRTAVADSGLRCLGPNTEGYFQVGGVAATFAGVVESALRDGIAPRRPGRKVSIVSQSGGLGFALFGRGLREPLDFHAVVTTGNEGDLDCADIVEALLDEGESGVILMFIEGLKDPQRFLSAARKAADADVPIVAMKIGRSGAGQRAAVSHTAHLAGADAAYDAIFERYGVIRVFDHEEMLAAAAGLARFGARRVKRAAIVTTSGGAGAWAADLLGAVGIDAPALSDALQTEIAAHLPEFGSAVNPVDVTAQAVEDGGRTLLNVLGKLSRSDEVDAVIVNMGLAKPGRVKELDGVLRPLLAAAETPILFHSHILPVEENFAALADLGAQAFASLRGCAAALQALDRRDGFLERWRRRRPASAPGAARLGPGPGGVLDETATRRLLDAYAVPLPPAVLARTPEEARRAATSIGFPVALKIQSPDIAHKTEAGGVALGVAADSLESAFARVVENCARHDPSARIDGVLVQKMTPRGHEVVIGVHRDADFGPLVMLGSGGIYLETLKDVIFALPPISAEEAFDLIDRLKIAPILKGVRGEKPADVAALAKLLSAVGDLARAESAVEQLDLNPVFVYPRGGGVLAVDALIVASARPLTTSG